MGFHESYTGKINRKLVKKIHVVDVATGRVPTDLVIKNASYVNVFSNSICLGDIAVAEGLIVGIGQYNGLTEIDASGKLVLPGFIDAHIHLESSLVAPSEFAKAVLPHGTTTVVTDPHEIANVMGTDGIEYMLQATEGLPMVINMGTIKPLDEQLVLDAAKKCGKVITCEEHSVIGGLGEAVAGILSEKLPTVMKRIGVNDEFGHSGPAADLLKAFGLSAEHIIEVAKEICG